MKANVGIYKFHLGADGGGDKRALALAERLSTKHNVWLITNERPDLRALDLRPVDLRPPVFFADLRPRVFLDVRLRLAAPFLPPLRAGPLLVLRPRPEPLFLPPPDSLFTVAHARAFAVFADTPRSS